MLLYLRRYRLLLPRNMFLVSGLLAHEMPGRQCADVWKLFPTCAEGDEDKTELVPRVAIKEPARGRSKSKKSSASRLNNGPCMLSTPVDSNSNSFKSSKAHAKSTQSHKVRTSEAFNQCSAVL